VHSKDSGQLKIRPRIVNNGSADVSVAITRPSAVRIIVSIEDGNRWSPPAKTKAAGDLPVIVSIKGARYAAIPPNVPNDTRIVWSGNFAGPDGWVTTWKQTILKAGNQAFSPLRLDAKGVAIHEGNLVFQLPLDAHGDMHPVAIALIDPTTDQVLAYQLANDWGSPSNPQSF